MQVINEFPETHFEKTKVQLLFSDLAYSDFDNYYYNNYHHAITIRIEALTEWSIPAQEVGRGGLLIKVGEFSLAHSNIPR